MVQLFLTIFMVVTYALAAAILTYVSICSIEDSKDQQQFETIAKSIEEQNENRDTDTTNKVYDLMLKNKDCVGWLKVVDMDVNYPVMLTKQNPEFYLRRDFNKEYSYIVKSIAKLEEKLNINKDFRLFNDNQFVGWKSYYDLPKVEKALSDMEAAMKTTNSFDLSIADRLCDSYPVEAVCSILTDSQKEILIFGVEFERDFGNDVSENIYGIYKAITDENTMLNDTQPEMIM